MPTPASEKIQIRQDFASCSEKQDHQDSKFEKLFDLLNLEVCVYIQEVNLSGKCLKNLPENFELLESLKSIDLSKNMLVKFDCKFRNLTYLNLASNLLENFDGEYLENIVELNLSNNRLKAIPLAYNACNLTLSDNQITTIDLEILAKCFQLI